MSALKALIKIALMSAFLFEEALITSRISDPAPNFAEREHPIPEERAH